MPFYRIAGTMVHMRGSKLPAPCQAIIKLRDGTKEYCAVPSASKERDRCQEHAAAAPAIQPGLFTGLVP